MSNVARVVLMALLMTMLTLSGTAVASAHAVRLTADPVENAELSVGPDLVSATFNERLQTTYAAMTVVGPDGNLWSSGEPQVQGAFISVALRPLGPTGSYTVHYRVTSADGHVVSGSWSFRLTVAGTGEPGPSVFAADNPSGGVPVWPFALGAVLVVAGGIWLARPKS